MSTTTEPTTNLRTFADLANGDTFTWEALGSYTCQKVVYGDGRTFYRTWGAGGAQHQVEGGAAGQPVYNVKTEAQRAAEYDAERAKEKEAKREAVREFNARMQEVAEALGKGWSCVLATGEHADETQSATLKGPKGLEVWAHSGSYSTRDRIAICGEVPRADGRGTQGSGRITVARGTHPTAIAGHIVRRLLPEYVKALEAAKAVRTAHEEHEDKTKATIAALVKATKGTASGQGSSVTVYAAGLPRMTVNGGNVTLDYLSVSVACMLDIVKVLRAHGEE